MGRLSRVLGRLRRRLDDDIAEEVSYHVDRLEAEGRAQGMDADAAREAARQRFGDPGVVRARTRDVFALRGVDGLWRDIRYAWRSLVRDPLTLLAVTVCLGLGIGVTTTFHGLLDALLVHDVSAREPDRLVRFAALSHPTWRDVRESQVFSELAAGGQCGTPVRWRDGEQQRAVVGNCLSANFWETVGGTTDMGRLWGESEATLETNPHLVVLSHRFWRRMAGGADVIGHSIVLNGAPYTILGVLPERYKAIQGYGISPDLYLSINLDLAPRALERDAPPRDRLRPVGRLHPGWSREQTRDALFAVLAAAQSEIVPARATVPELTPVSGLAKYGTEGFDRLVLTLSGLVSAIAVLFLAIACANTAGMMLARATRRSQQLQVCRALGATSSQLVRQQLVESLVVGALGSVVGLGVCYVASRLCSAIVIPVQDVTLSLAFVPDRLTVVVGVAVGLGSAVVSGLSPALEARRTTFVQMQTRTTSAQPHIRRWLLGGQVCLSALLLFVTFLAWQNTRIVTGQSPGFAVENIAWLDISLDRRLPLVELESRRDRLLETLQGHPGVAAVSWTWYLPFQVVYAQPTVRSSLGQSSVEVRAIEQGVGPGYFETMQIPVIDGREFSRGDLAAREDVPPMAVINHTLARSLFGDRSAVGERIWRVVSGQEPVAVTVIGVTADTAFRVPGEASPPMLHSLAQQTASFVARTRVSPAAAIPELSRVIDSAVPGAAAGGYPFAERHGKATFPARALTVVLGGFAISGLILTIAALVGLASYNIARRRREIGIRLALGATPGRVIAMMLVQHVRVVVLGSALGCVFAVWVCARLSHLAAADVSPNDLGGVVMVVAILSTSAVAVVFLLARRAAYGSPSVALAQE
jgi:putative ABC transport system permease protein